MKCVYPHGHLRAPTGEEVQLIAREDGYLMPGVTDRVRLALVEIAGEDRVRTDLRERKMYSFDIGAMPKLVKPFVPAGIAGAVVRTTGWRCAAS